MPNSLALVADFHRTFGHPVLNEPSIPPKNRCDLRVELIREELDELKEAIENRDIVGVADALCDIQYVLSGAVLEFGLQDDFKALFEEVQRSNMSKACETEEIARETVAHFREKGQEAYYAEKDGKYLVFRKSDDKTLKSVNYSPANLHQLLNQVMTERS